MKPVVPTNVLELEPYKPGRPIEEVERELGLRGTIKLASNENPLGPSPKALAAMHEACAGVHRYPEGAAVVLASRLAAKLDVSTDRLTFGNGSNELIDLLIRMLARPGVPVEIPTVEIVGVVRQVKAAAAETRPVAQAYVPLAQNRWWIASLVVRPERGDASALAGPMRAAVARIDREVAVARMRTMATITDDAMSRPRFRALLVGAFAALALTLAMVGIFGVLAQLVQQRMREFGVRIALGASRRNVIGLVLGHATRITVAGLIAGLALAAMLGRLMAALIYPVTPSDPLTFAVVPIVAALTAAAACVAPAWRATRVDPATAFRDE